MGHAYRYGHFELAPFFQPSDSKWYIHLTYQEPFEKKWWQIWKRQPKPTEEFCKEANTNKTHYRFDGGQYHPVEVVSFDDLDGAIEWIENKMSDEDQLELFDDDDNQRET